MDVWEEAGLVPGTQSDKARPLGRGGRLSVSPDSREAAGVQGESTAHLLGTHMWLGETIPPFQNTSGKITFYSKYSKRTTRFCHLNFIIDYTLCN